jgi:hypothetical protein
MRRSWLWQRVDGPGLEHFEVHDRPDVVVMEGTIVGSLNEMPLSLNYTLRCDARFAVQSVDVACEARETRRVVLNHDAQGRWTDGGGAEMPLLAGCDGLDIAATPSTNTLAIRKLRLSAGESAEVRVVYIAVPGLELSVDRQRYTLLRRGHEESVYRFESLDAAPGFVAEISVDADGFVVDYEGLFRRL